MLPRISIFGMPHNFPNSPKQPHRPRLPLLPRFQNQPFSFKPVVGAGAGQFAVGGIAENNCFTAQLP